jgi:hypothetical protein
MVIEKSSDKVTKIQSNKVVSTINDNQLPPMTTDDIQKIIDKWQEILRVVRPFNHSVEGLLRSTRPIAFDGTNLTLEVFYKFHKDKLSEEKCRTIVEDCVATVLEAPKIVVNLVLGKAKPQEDLSKVAESIFK